MRMLLADVLHALRPVSGAGPVHLVQDSFGRLDDVRVETQQLLRPWLPHENFPRMVGKGSQRAEMARVFMGLADWRLGFLIRQPLEPGIRLRR